MGENIPEQPLPPNEHPPQPESTSHHTFSPSIIGGVIILLAGLFLLLQNFGMRLPVLHNWWALFILIPTVAVLSNAYRSYRAAGGQITYYVRNQIVGGLLILAVGLIFLLGLDWGRLWPVFLIVIGLGVMLNTFGSQQNS
jgi:hypothetical protein